MIQKTNPSWNFLFLFQSFKSSLFFFSLLAYHSPSHKTYKYSSHLNTQVPSLKERTSDLKKRMHQPFALSEIFDLLTTTTDHSQEINIGYINLMPPLPTHPPRFTYICSWGCLIIHKIFFISIHSPPIHQLRFQVLGLGAYIQGKTQKQENRSGNGA